MKKSRNENKLGILHLLAVILCLLPQAGYAAVEIVRYNSRISSGAQGKLDWVYLPLRLEPCEGYLFPSVQSLHGSRFQDPNSISHNQGKLGVFFNRTSQELIYLNDYFVGPADLIKVDTGAGWALVRTLKAWSDEKQKFFRFDFATKQMTELSAGEGEDKRTLFAWVNTAISDEGGKFVIAEPNGLEFIFTIWDLGRPDVKAKQYRAPIPEAQFNYGAEGLKISNDGLTLAFPFRELPGAALTRTQVIKITRAGDGFKVLRPPGALQWMSPDGRLMITKAPTNKYRAYRLKQDAVFELNLKDLKPLIDSFWRMGPKHYGADPLLITSSQTSIDGRWLALEFAYKVLKVKRKDDASGASMAVDTALRVVARWDISKPHESPEIFRAVSILPNVDKFAWHMIDTGSIQLAAISGQDLVLVSSDALHEPVRYNYASLVPEAHSMHRVLQFSRDGRAILLGLGNNTLVFQVRADSAR